MYGLSNRQKKSLLVRKTPLLIALPMPEHKPANLLDYARRVITDVEAYHIVAAREVEIAVQLPPIGSTGLTGIYGTIVDRAADNLPEPLIVVVIEVRIEPPGSRHKPDPIAWPATHVDRTGGKWPKQTEPDQ